VACLRGHAYVAGIRKPGAGGVASALAADIGRADAFSGKGEAVSSAVVGAGGGGIGQPAAQGQGGGALRHPISRKLEDDRSRGERIADTIAVQIGSWRFLIIQTTLVALWIGFNLLGLSLSWDPYPFVLLNLMFSVQAAYTGPILLLSQNRSAQRDRTMAEHNYTTNEKAEQLTESLLSEVLRNSQATLAIAKHLGIQLDGIEQHEQELEHKINDVQAQLAEVEDVLEEQPDIPTRDVAGGQDATVD
jgi:uncharacterized membrane protein